ncbi:DUF6088 family protein [Bordetella genomosp. 1]|nr:DUF6088 family protein [Bordetella genomosp. 1]
MMSLKQRMLRSIKRRAGNVVLRSDVARLGSATQVSEALRQLQRDGTLLRIGTGVYAKTRRSAITGNLIAAGSLETLAIEALHKLGIAVRPGKAASDYNARRTTQLPGKVVVDTGSRRISRMIAVGGRALHYENHYRQAKTDA